MNITTITIDGVLYDIKDEALSLAIAQHISSGGTSHSVATESQAGFLSAEDKIKLDGVAAEANKYILTNQEISTALSGLAEEATESLDEIPFLDVSDTRALKKITFASITSGLKDYFDTLYSKIIPGITIPDAATISVNLTPGVVTKIETLNTCTSLTITLGGGNWWDDYKVIFTTGTVPPTISFPASITRWAGGTPTIEANKRYEVSILDGTGVVSSV